MHHRLIAAVLLVCHLGTLASPVLAGRIKLGDLVRKVDPRAPVRTARDNWREGRFFATDNSVHPSPRAAIKRSMFPTDVRANVKAALTQRFHWTRLIGAVISPVSIEAQRQLTSGEGFNMKRLVQAIDPKVMATTMAGGVIGEVGGAMAQSALAKLGPAGAIAGFVARPLISFGASIMGYNIGRNAGAGSFRSAIAGGLREIEPGRDLGQIAGYTLGAVLGQALIPIPVLGGIIGGTIFGLIGGSVGNWLSKSGPLAGVSNWIKGGLGALADWIEGKKQPAPVAAAAATEPGKAGPGILTATEKPDGNLSLLGVEAQR